MMSMKTHRKALAKSRGRYALTVMVVAGWLLAGCGAESDEPQAAAQPAAPPMPVAVAEMAYQDIDLDKSYPSLLRSDDEVVLVARVTGTLEARHFEPGERVGAGQRLYTIEPDLYQAAVNQREADLQSARAELSRAQRDAERFERLLNQNSVSRQQVDQARADLGVARASVAQAEAALASANIDLGYAEVTAPVSGVIGLSQVNIGNLVSSGTELATITPLDPLEVRFQLPQREALELRRQLQGQAIDSVAASLEVPGETRLMGHLSFLGSRVSEGTSTVQAAAVFANPDAAVLPGQFVRVRIEGLKRYDVLAVPEIAITQGLMGPQVFVLDEENVARARTVDLGEVAGPWQIIREGLAPGDRVVVGDPAGLQPGTSIEPQPFDGDVAGLGKEAEQDAEAAAPAEEAGEDDAS